MHLILALVFLAPTPFQDSSEYVKAGHERYKQKDYDGAIEQYTKAIELSPNTAGPYFDRGNAKARKESYDGALGDFNRALELDPKMTSAYVSRGWVKKLTKDLDGALGDFNKAIELDPSRIRAYMDRGVTRLEKDDYAGSVADFTRVIELDPKYAGAYKSRAYARYYTRSWTDALLDFRKCCELQPVELEYPHLFIWLIRSRLGERDAANKELAEYLKGRKGEKADDWFSKVALFLIGEFSEEDLLKAEVNGKKTVREQHCEATFYIGSCRLIAGDKAGAKDLFHKCVATGEKDFVEYEAAVAELRGLEGAK